MWNIASLQASFCRRLSACNAYHPIFPGRCPGLTNDALSGRQARARGGAYCQVSYSRAGKLHCDYVRPDYEPVVRAEIETYRRYRELTRLWIDLELEISRLKQRRSAGETSSA